MGVRLLENTGMVWSEGWRGEGDVGRENSLADRDDRHGICMQEKKAGVYNRWVQVSYDGSKVGRDQRWSC